MKIDILTASITTDAEPLVLELLDRIGRARALHDDESLLVEKIVRRAKRHDPTFTHQWTRDEDRELLRAQFRPRGVIELAARIGVSEKSARRRLEKLVQARRNQGKCRVSPDQVEG